MSKRIFSAPSTEDVQKSKPGTGSRKKLKMPPAASASALISTSGASKEPAVVLEKIRKLRNACSNRKDSAGAKNPEIASSGIVEVVERDAAEVSGKIEDLVISIVHQILTGGSFEFSVPNRGTSNQLYIEELDRNVLGEKVVPVP